MNGSWDLFILMIIIMKNISNNIFYFSLLSNIIINFYNIYLKKIFILLNILEISYYLI